MPDENNVYHPTEEERKKWGMGKYGVRFLKSTLLELSVCPVPANPSAGRKALGDTLAQAKAAELIDDERLKAIARAIDESEAQEDTPTNTPDTTPDVTEESPEVAEDQSKSVSDNVVEYYIKLADGEINELKGLITENLNRIKILSEKIGNIQETVDKIASRQRVAPDPAVSGEPESKANDDDDIYEAVLGESIGFLKSIKSL
jgi:hypothetical protein